MKWIGKLVMEEQDLMMFLEAHRFHIPLLLLSVFVYAMYMSWAAKIPFKYHRKVLR